MRWLKDRFMTVDRRLLGAFRILFGVVLLMDVLRRIPHAAMFYSDAGVLPSALALDHPLDEHVASLFFLLPTPRAAQLGMLLLAGVYVMYIAGYRTKLAQVLALVGFASLNARNLLVENRGHVEMSIALVWTLFLPLGDCYSVDARRARTLGKRWPRPTTPVVRLAMLAIVLQTAAIYFFNAIQKDGAVWGDGQAVHYVMWQNRAATSYAAWIRLHEPSWYSPLLTHGTIIVEGTLALLVISPIGQRYTRTAFFFMALALHAGVALTLNVWPHSYVIVAVNVLLLPRSFVDAANERLAWMRAAGSISSVEPAPVPRGPPKLTVAREVVVALLLATVMLQLAHDNRATPERLRPNSMGWLAPIIGYPRMYQQWSMFAFTPRTDGTLVVDAVTEDGQRIDPLTGRAPDFEAPLHGPWHQSQLQCDYYFQIQRESRAPYVDGLARYLTAWQRLEGRPPGDRLVRFEVYWVSNDSPEPGEITPSNIRRRLLVSGPPESNHPTAVVDR
jgi:hypothetical protein